MQVEPRKKSPRAPSIPLDQALERTLRVYDQERLHAAPADAVAQALGYKNANNGAALASIASLRYFGLLERPKEGFLSVAKSVETYKYAPDEGMKQQIIVEFLKTPPLYQELLERYSSGLPSLATLKYELIQKGFLPQAVDGVLSTFQQSVSFVKYFDLPVANAPRENSPQGKQNEIRPFAEDESEQAIQNKPDGTLNLQPEADPNFDQIPIRLSGGRKAWLKVPMPFYESDKARIKAQIDVLFVDETES